MTPANGQSSSSQPACEVDYTYIRDKKERRRMQNRYSQRRYRDREFRIMADVRFTTNDFQVIKRSIREEDRWTLKKD
jgi:hypothetical protein